MSDQGERGTRWTDMSENGAGGEMADAPTGPLPAQPAAGRDPRKPAGSPSRRSFPEIEVKVPEVAIPEPTGRTEFSESPFAEPAAPEPAPAEETEYHDVWGKVEAPHLRKPKAESQDSEPQPHAHEPEPEDPAPQWSDNPRARDAHAREREPQWSDEPRAHGAHEREPEQQWPDNPHASDARAHEPKQQWSDEPRARDAQVHEPETQWTDEPRAHGAHERAPEQEWSDDPRVSDAQTHERSFREAESRAYDAHAHAPEVQEPERGAGTRRAAAARGYESEHVAAEERPAPQPLPTVEAKTQSTQDLAAVIGPVEFDVEPAGQDESGSGSPSSGPWWHDEPREPVPAWEEPRPSRHEAPAPADAQRDPAVHGQDAYGPGSADGASGPRGADVKVAPVSEPGGGQAGWEGSLFEGDAGSGGEDGRYAAVADPTAASGTARPGRPSSGNWQMPGWMADEKSADDMLAGGDGGDKRRTDGFDDEGGGGRSRVLLFGGVGLLVVALVAAGGVYFMKGHKDGSGASTASDGRQATPPAARKTTRPESPKTQLPPDKPLAKFAGKPGKIAGRATDAKAGLSYPRFADPWQAPTKKNKLAVAGWSGQQILVTEKHGDRVWSGRLLTGSLLPSLQSHYQGPESLKEVTALAVRGFDKEYYAFDHTSAPLASEEITVGAHKGWLIANYLKYKRPGVKATGEVVVTAVIDTGHKTPAVVFASIPNTDRKLWPDLNAFLDGLKVAS